MTTFAIPPTPLSSINENENFVGQELTNLLKRIDKKNKVHGKNKQQQVGPHDNNDDDDDENDTNDEDHLQIITILRNLITVFQRKGLLQGNLEVAQSILSSSSSSNSNNSKKKNGKSDRRSANNEDLSMLIHDDVGVSNNKTTGSSNSSTAIALDTQLIISSLVRILEKSISSDDESAGTNTEILQKVTIIALVADIITVCCQSMNQLHGSITNNSNTTLLLASEYELLAGSGKTILNGLEHRIREMLHSVGRNEKNSNDDKTASFRVSIIFYDNDDNEGDNNDDYLYYALTSCSRAVTCLVHLFGNKLSRSTSLLQRLREVGWETLLLVHENTNTVYTTTTQPAAARLLASLPLAGGIQCHTPNQYWNELVVDCTVCLSTIIDRVVAPPSSSLTRYSKRNGTNDSNTSNMKDNKSTNNPATANTNFVQEQVLTQWLDTFITLSTSSDNNASNLPLTRVNMFLQAMKGFTLVLQYLLVQHQEASSSIGSSTNRQHPVEIDIPSILNMIETMITYSTIAETNYCTTKKRLRNDNSNIIVSFDTKKRKPLFSPLFLVENIALPLKEYGYQILKAVLSSISSASLPYARRISHIAYRALLSSASSVLQQVIDPTISTSVTVTSSNKNNGNKGQKGQQQQQKRWLNKSITIRTIAIETYQQIVLLFGVDPSVLVDDVTRSRSLGRIRDTRSRNCCTEQALVVICGSIIEQLSSVSSTASSDDDDWGTFQERIELLSKSFQCVIAALRSGGEYLPNTCRTLIDSVIDTYLQAILSTTSHPRLCHPTIKAFLLQAGIATINTPWQDGSSCPIVDTIRQAAVVCRTDSDGTVASVAASVLGSCQTIASPRAPALRLVTQSQQEPHVTSSSSSTKLMSSYQRTDFTSANGIWNSLQNTKRENDEIEAARKHNYEKIPSKSDEDENDRVAKKAKVESKTSRTNEVTSNKENSIKSSNANSPGQDSMKKVSDTTFSEANGNTPKTSKQVEEPITVMESGEQVTSEKYGVVGTSKQSELTDEEAIDNDSPKNINDNNKDDEDDDEFMPMIIDCGPDDEDGDD